MVRQLYERDCGIASLAVVAEASYEDAYVAVKQVDRRHRGKQGLDNREIVKAARKLDLLLVPTRKYDLDDDEGVLRIRWNDPVNEKANPGGHFVAVLEGRVWCPKDGIWVSWRDYFDRSCSRPCTLLRGPA